MNEGENLAEWDNKIAFCDQYQFGFPWREMAADSVLRDRMKEKT